MADDNNNKMKEIFIKYNYLIFSFEKFIEGVYQNKEEDLIKNIHKGYIVNLKEYDELKENINYNKVKSFYSSQNIDKEKILQHCDINKFKKLKNFNFHQIEFNTPRYLIYRLDNKENFIIINEQIWNCFGENDEKNKYSIEYKVEENNQISINFENESNIIVKSDNNIINEYSLKYSKKVEEYKDYIEEYKNIIKDINSYYSIEKEFLDNITKKEKSNAPKSGYLISFSWINKWKKITNYEKIKFLMTLNNNNINNISDAVIYHLEKNKFKYNDLPPLEIYSFKSKNDLDEFLKNDYLVIVDNSFIQSFKNKSKEIITIYNLDKNAIQINTNKEMIYEIYKNIIMTKEKLIIFFLKKLFKMIKFNPSEQNNNNIFLINGQILEDMKNIFDYNRMNKTLINNNIYYNSNFGEYFSEVLKIIKNDGEFIDKLKKINFIDEMKNINNNYNLSGKHDDLKLIPNKIISFDYPDNFVIVDEDIILFLYENNIINMGQKAKFLNANYILKDGKILLILKEKDDKYLYTIGQISSDGHFINEFIIKEENNKKGMIKNFCNLNRIKDLIDNFLKEENKNMIKKKEELIGYFIKIETNEIKENENQIIINNSINNNITEESLKKENEDFIIKIISLVSLLYSFEKEIKNKLKDSLNNNTILKSINTNQSYYLIKSDFIFQIKI